MKRVAILFSLLAVFLWVGSSMAYSLTDLGIQITIPDGITNSTWGVGSKALGVAGEDDETEGNPNTYTYQRWDLEGMFWNKTTSSLYMIGGFNFDKGVDNYSIGDVFIGDEYVLDLSRDTDGNLENSGSFSTIQGYTGTIGASDISASNPYLYSAGGSSVENGTYSVSNFTSDNTTLQLFKDWGNDGDTAHYILQINVGSYVAGLINSGNQIHLTMECGNDDMEGRAPVPEPATALLFGVGLIGLATIGRKKFQTQK